MNQKPAILRLLNRLIRPVVDLKQLGRGVWRYGKFLHDLREFRKTSTDLSLKIIDLDPQLHDFTSTSTIDAHYYYSNGWAMRRILRNSPEYHVDIGSQVIFSNLLSSVMKVAFVEYRPLIARIDGLWNMAGDILALPFPSNCLPSVSSLHVIEHIGLGRYGDRLDPEGTQKAARELSRVLAPLGFLYLAVPVGVPRICFNAHRILPPQKVIGLFNDLNLVEFSVVDDMGRYTENADRFQHAESQYACGLFIFQKPANRL